MFLASQRRSRVGAGSADQAKHFGWTRYTQPCRIVSTLPLIEAQCTYYFPFPSNIRSQDYLPLPKSRQGLLQVLERSFCDFGRCTNKSGLL